MPISSFFFPSTLMTGSFFSRNPDRIFAIYLNCSSLIFFSSFVSFRPPLDTFLLLHFREYLSFLRMLPTVVALTLMSIFASSSEIFSLVFLVQSSPDIGSPAVSYSINSSIFSITSGIFFNCLSATSLSSCGINCDLPAQQFFPALGNSLFVQGQ